MVPWSQTRNSHWETVFRGCHVRWRVCQQRCQADDVPWNLPGQEDLGTRRRQQGRPGTSRLKEEQMLWPLPSDGDVLLGLKATYFRRTQNLPEGVIVQPC